MADRVVLRGGFVDETPLALDPGELVYAGSQDEPLLYLGNFLGDAVRCGPDLTKAINAAVAQLSFDAGTF